MVKGVGAQEDLLVTLQAAMTVKLFELFEQFEEFEDVFVDWERAERRVDATALLFPTAGELFPKESEFVADLRPCNLPYPVQRGALLLMAVEAEGVEAEAGGIRSSAMQP